MSDLLLATQITLSEVYPESRNDLDIMPNPLRTFHSTQPMFIYLEMYNLKRNTFGRTKYEIANRIGRPKEEEIDPALFFELDLPEGEIEITLVDQPGPQPGLKNNMRQRSRHNMKVTGQKILRIYRLIFATCRQAFTNLR